MTETVRRVLIVGRDAQAWLIALALQRAFGASGLIVEVVELPSLVAASDVLAALPSLQSFHKIIDLDEGAVVTAARAVPMAGQRFSDWGVAPFIQAYDSAAAPGAALQFAQLWIKAHQKGMPVPFEEFSFGAMAARLSRVPSESDDPAGLGATFGYNLEASAYALLLKAFAVRRGVNLLAGTLSDIKVEDGRIAAVTLSSGQQVAADLFIDASGSEGTLIRQLPGDGFESWSDLLPCDRLLSASTSRLENLPAFSEIRANKAGWTGLYPLQDRTAILAVFKSDFASPQDVLASLSSVTPGPIQGDPVLSELKPGVRNAPWIGNCVSVGDAAAVLDPLDALHLHMAHVCVSNLINFWPVSPAMGSEAKEYNRNVRLHAANLRDFESAHYKLNKREGEPFWDAARDRAVSPGLEQKLLMFRKRGLNVLFDEETFDEHSWTSMFLGHGLMPESYDPRVDLLAEQDHIETIQARLRQIGALVPTLPTVDSFVSATSIPVKAPATAS